MAIITIDRDSESFVIWDKTRDFNNSFTCEITDDKLNYLMNADLDEVKKFIKEKINKIL